MVNELMESLEKIIGTVYYKGCNIEISKNQYKVFNRVYATLSEAKKAIDNSFNFLSQSIKK